MDTTAASAPSPECAALLDAVQAAQGQGDEIRDPATGEVLG